MAEYIKKSEAIEVLEFYESIGAYHDYRLKDSMQNIKPADVAEVVRCNDCKHNPKLQTRTKNTVWCRNWRSEVRVDGFCSYGERRES